jgi:hypothetical protein
MVKKSKSKIKAKKPAKVIKNDEPSDLHKQLKRSSIAAIIYATLILPILMVAPIATQTTWLKIITVVLITVTTMLFICVMQSFCKLTKKWKFKFVQIMTKAMIILAIMIGINNITTVFVNINTNLLAMILSWLTGVVFVMFGIGIMHLKKRAGNLVKALGILFIISGAFSASLVLLVLTPALVIATTVIQAVLFHDLAKKY